MKHHRLFSPVRAVAMASVMLALAIALVAVVPPQGDAQAHTAVRFPLVGNAWNNVGGFVGGNAQALYAQNGCAAYAFRLSPFTSSWVEIPRPLSNVDPGQAIDAHEGILIYATCSQ